MKNIYQKDYHKKYSQELLARKHLLDFVKENVIVKDKIVLDAGCNGGFLSFFMTHEGAKKVYGLDMSPGFIKSDIKRAKDEKIMNKFDFKVGNVEKLPYKDNFFDFIVSSEVIEHVERPEVVVNEFNRVLKKGGSILITTPNILNPMEIFHNLKHYCLWVLKKEPITHIQHFTFKNLRRLFDNKFKVIKITGVGIGAAFLPLSKFGFVKKIDYLIGESLQPISFDLFLLAKKK